MIALLVLHLKNQRFALYVHVSEDTSSHGLTTSCEEYHSGQFKYDPSKGLLLTSVMTLAILCLNLHTKINVVTSNFLFEYKTTMLYTKYGCFL